MSNEEKRDIESTVAILKQLDEPSLRIIESNVKVLAARQAMAQEKRCVVEQTA